FYNNLINELVKPGTYRPCLINAVLYHMDLPQIFEEEYGGWVSPKTIDDFTAYTDVCFREFGDRFAHWTTMLEPNIMAQAAGNSTTEPYLFVHQSLLAHASTVRLYRKKYQAAQKGIIGMNIYTMWLYPFTDSAEDIEATERATTFLYGWYVVTYQISGMLHPLVFGDYPEIMKKIAGSRLPFFSNNESELVTNAFDFIGLHHYTSLYASNHPNSSEGPLHDFTADLATLFRVYLVVSNNLKLKFHRSNAESSTVSSSSFLNYITRTLQISRILHPLEKYGNLSFYILENGYGGSDGTLNDLDRIGYLTKYIASTLKEIRNGADVRGYSVWSFMDLYEIYGGFKTHYGLVAVEFDTEERRRQPRRSAHCTLPFTNHKTQGVISPGSFAFGAGTADYQVPQLL
ncbi:hypothetical protein SETIT_3G270400v2, partial [Setaria italica]